MRVLAVVVCLFVCLCFTRGYGIKTAKRTITQTTPRDSPETLVFDAKIRWWTTPASHWNFALKVTHPFFEHYNVDQYPLMPPQPWQLEIKVRLTLVGSRPCATQRAIDEPCTLPLSPQKGSTKSDFAAFASKIQLLSKEFSCKVSLCINFQQQRCSYIIPLFNGP